MEYQNPNNVKPAQTPIVSIELQRLEKMQMELSEMVAGLESRLMVAMREPETTQKHPDTASIAPTQSQLAVVLRARVNEAESLGYRLASILSRLEI